MKTPDKLKLNVGAKRGMLGKPTGQFVASMLGVEQTASTKEEAVEKLTEILDKTMERAYARTYLVTTRGTVFALYHVPGGWAYDIIRTDNPGQVHPGSCMMGESYMEAIASMKRHHEQFQADENLSLVA